MAFESLTNKLNKAFKNLSGKGKLTESNMNEMLKEVRMSLLEADVNYRVVKDFIARVKEKAMGQEVMDSLNPSQMVVKIVHDEIVHLLGDGDNQLNLSHFSTIMLVGLQGTGKTTAAAKIANLLKKKKDKKVLLVACDIIRPAAIEQLKTLGNSIDVEVYSEGVGVDVLTQVKHALDYAKMNRYDTLIFDTAGRLHVDEELMQELKDIEDFLKPNEILLTVDAMSGQDIVSVAESFTEKLNVTGLVATKMDGDSRGGGILSVRSLTNIPVKFASQGEKIDDLDIFYPDRMADRILGMGDIMTLVEQAQEKMDLEESEKTAKKMMSGRFTLEDMLSQLKQVNKLGSISGIMKMIPGMSQMAGQIDEVKAANNMKKTEAIILSMTQQERDDPSILKASRKQRIARGSGVQVSDVNKLLKQFEQMQQMMKMMGQMQSGKMPNMNMMNQMARSGFNSKPKEKKKTKGRRR
ncbi:MAG: signal recognition particle protein [Traorella sp.]